MTTRAVMKAVGQPYQRLGSTYRFCAKTGTDPKVMVTVTFSPAGKVRRVAAVACQPVSGRRSYQLGRILLTRPGTDATRAGQ